MTQYKAQSTCPHCGHQLDTSSISESKKPVVDTPEKASSFFDYIRNKKQECFALLTLDGAMQPIRKRTITIGTLTQSFVHPREVFAHAIKDRAASIIIAHNHPSGSLAISDSDKEVTRRISDVGELMGIKLIDHIIVTRDDAISAMHI